MKEFLEPHSDFRMMVSIVGDIFSKGKTMEKEIVTTTYLFFNLCFLLYYYYIDTMLLYFLWFTICTIHPFIRTCILYISCIKEIYLKC